MQAAVQDHFVKRRRVFQIRESPDSPAMRKKQKHVIGEEVLHAVKQSVGGCTGNPFQHCRARQAKKPLAGNLRRKALPQRRPEPPLNRLRSLPCFSRNGHRTASSRAGYPIEQERSGTSSTDGPTADRLETWSDTLSTAPSLRTQLLSFMLAAKHNRPV